MSHAVWKKLLSDTSIQRSSQTLAVIGSSAYIYGGELQPREPVDSEVHCVSIDCANAPDSTLSTITGLSNAPQPRVGSAATALGRKIYIFSGRGGIAMAPIEENGAFWVFDSTSSKEQWTQTKPADPKAAYPVGRSYHAVTNDDTDTIFLHAGCPENGRLRDLWAFNISTRQWTELPSAPGPERGGSSIAYHEGKIYRMNGFDGKTEQGGALDVFDLATSAWSTITYAPDGIDGPSARSVSSLLAITVDCRPSLATMFGEHDPSSLGHQGAGKMLSDAWLFDIQSKQWSNIDVGGEAPPARGWFDADVVDGVQSGIIVHGGLAESNQRLRDVWMLEF